MKKGRAAMARMKAEGQARASEPGKSVLLTASAGSGKTSALVARILRLLLAGADPGGVAAITFTDKAAAQMKERLFGALGKAVWEGEPAEEVIGLDGSRLGHPLVKTPEEVFSELVSRPEALKVSTIHAFCHALLKRFPLEAGVPAGFSVMDESEIPLRRDAAASECLEAAVGTPLEADLWTLSDAGFDVPRIKDLLALSLDKRGQLFMFEARAGGREALDRSLADLVAGYGARFDEAVGDPAFAEEAGLLADMLERYGAETNGDGLGALRRARSLEDFRHAFNLVFGLFYTWKDNELTLKKRLPLTKSAVRKSLSGALNGKALDAEAAAVYARYEETHLSFAKRLSALAALHDGCIAAEAALAFVRLFRTADSLYTARNHGDGLLDFDDLELFAYRLLSGPDGPRVLNRLDERILHYLVDEFQDTGELQWAILERLGSEAFSGQGAEGPFAPTFFAVGDKKQSIYRFRKAEYRLMGALREKMESSIEPGRRDFPSLDYNFRSSPDVLKVIDETFGKLIEGYAPSRPFREDNGGSVRLRVASGEAEALAEEIEAALGLPVWDGKKHRPARWGDMAVLIRSRTGLPEYEKALRAHGIGFKVVGGIGFFFQEEVQAVLNILKYLNNGADKVALSAFLKSPLFGLSDGEIEQVVGGGPDALDRFSGRARRTLDAGAASVRDGSIGELVEAVIKESGAAAAFGQCGGPAAVLNLEKLVATAHDFAARGGAGLQDFVEWVAAYRDMADMATADLDLPRFHDFVTIMTVHAAKGLEFPVVFLPGSGRRRNNRVSPLLVGNGRLALKTSALLGKSPAYYELGQAEASEQDMEETRLLYVAMTRAKDHMVLIAEDKKPAEGSWLAKLYKASPVSLFGDDFKAPPGPCEYDYPKGARAARMAPVARDEEQALALPDPGRLAPLPPAGVIRWLSPSSMASHLPDEGATRFGPLLRGSIIHRCIEVYGNSGSYSVQAAAEAEDGFAALGYGERKALLEDIQKVMDALLSAPEIKALLSPGDGKYFELPLLMKHGDEVVYGHADLVVVEGQKARVIDYKTGYSEAPVEALVEAYRPQLEAYGEAVKEAFGVEGVEAGLLLVDRKALYHLDFPPGQE